MINLYSRFDKIIRELEEIFKDFENIQNDTKNSAEEYEANL